MIQTRLYHAFGGNRYDVIHESYLLVAAQLKNSIQLFVSKKRIFHARGGFQANATLIRLIELHLNVVCL